MEKTLVLIKPDAIRQNIHLNILSDFLSVEGVEMKECHIVMPIKKQILNHYANDIQRIKNHGGDINKIVQYMVSDCVYVMIFEGENVISKMLQLRGAKTLPNDCDSGTIRYKYRDYFVQDDHCIQNFVHTSRSHKDAMREIRVWF